MKTCECDRHWWESELEGKTKDDLRALFALIKQRFPNKGAIITAWDWKCEHGDLEDCDERCNEKVKDAIYCPENHIDTYINRSKEHGLMLMCNVCEDGYSISFEEVTIIFEEVKDD